MIEIINIQTVDSLELTELAIHELLLLMSLRNLNGLGTASEILSNLHREKYYRYPVSRLTFTLEYCLEEDSLERSLRVGLCISISCSPNLSIRFFEDHKASLRVRRLSVYQWSKCNGEQALS